MKLRKRNDVTVNGVRQGFNERDAYQLRKWHNPLSNPPVQIWSYEDLEPEPEERAYHCVMCRSKLDYIKNLEVWKCDECQEFYDTKIQDVPVKNTNQFKATPWFELQHYPTYDLDDIEAPFIEGINHDTMLEEDIEQRTYEDKRIQRIHIKGSFADAIMAGALSSKKQAQQEDG